MRCIALEQDPELAELARARLPGAEVRGCEALLGAGELPPIDVVVGNPPYVRSLRADRSLRVRLRGQLASTSHGEWDLYTAFIERSYQWLAPKGQLALVVPSRWMTAQSASGLRALLAQRGAVRGVVDFGSEQIFAGATTYVSTLFLGAESQPGFCVARLGGGKSDFEIGSIASESLGSAPWQLSVGQGRELLEAMQLAGPPLGEIARIVKGAGTNADRVYVLDADSDVEAELIRPCIRGRDVGKVHETRCLVPYRADGQLIEPDVLRREFPRAMAHLESNRDILDSRERGRFRGERFYQFGRPQNMETLLSTRPKIVVPDVTREGRAVLDTRGSMVLDSAYAVIPHREEDFERVLAVLSSPAVGLWLRETGIPLRGGYLRMKTATLRTLPVAARSVDLRQAYGVTSERWSKGSSGLE